MKKVIVLVLACVIAIICLVGCVQREERLPAGVHEVGSYRYYIVRLPNGKKASDYFKATNFDTTNLGPQAYVNFEGRDCVVYYREVPEGGWVAYTKDLIGHFAYMPSNFPNESLYTASYVLALHIIKNSDDCLTIEQAKQYIPLLSPV